MTKKLKYQTTAPAETFVKGFSQGENTMTEQEKLNVNPIPDSLLRSDNDDAASISEATVVPSKKNFMAAVKQNVSAHKKAYIGAGVAVTGAGAGFGLLVSKYGTKKALAMISFYSRKYLPAGLAVTGGIGLVATAYLAYKAAPEIEKRLDFIEEQRSAGVRVSSLSAARIIAGPLWKPILVGAGSLSAIAGSYVIMNGRINTLTKLSRQQARAIKEGMSPVTQQEIEGADGEKDKVNVEVNRELNDLLGRWMHYSDQWISDDIAYMNNFIDGVEDRMQARLFQRGYLTMNEVLDALGFERTSEGAALGWDVASGFFLDKKFFNNYEETDTDTTPTNIFVQWTPAHNVYDQVAFTGRYAVDQG